MCLETTEKKSLNAYKTVGLDHWISEGLFPSKGLFGNLWVYFLF